jgi:hypothetical protein
VAIGSGDVQIAGPAWIGNGADAEVGCFRQLRLAAAGNLDRRMIAASRSARQEPILPATAT